MVAQPLHEYFFNNNLLGVGGGPTLTQNLTCGASAGAFGVQTVAVVGQTCSTSNVFCFNAGGGLNYPNPNYITNQYTINMFFKFNTLGGYSRIIDFKNSASDNGAYFYNTCLNFYPNGNVGTCPYFIANTYYLITLVRISASNTVNVYVNGVLFTSYNDASGDYRCATNSTPIIFFRDDNAVTCEAKAGCIRYASITSATTAAPGVMTTFTNICNIILPVELTSFNAVEKNNVVYLNWTSETEKNNKLYEIERSKDGYNFEKIGEVKGNGDTRKTISYNSTDASPHNGTNYYRLKQTDFNGDFDYSNIVYVTMERDIPFFYPNPANEYLTFKQNDADADISIKNILGLEVMRIEGKQLSGNNQVDIAHLPSGTYFVSVKDKTQKLVINR